MGRGSVGAERGGRGDYSVGSDARQLNLFIERPVSRPFTPSSDRWNSKGQVGIVLDISIRYQRVLDTRRKGR